MKELIAQAQKILSHEQRIGCTNHAVQGGLEAFIAYWLGQVESTLCQEPSSPANEQLISFGHLFANYRIQTPAQRQSNLTKAQALLATLSRADQSIGTSDSSFQLRADLFTPRSQLAPSAKTALPPASPLSIEPIPSQKKPAPARASASPKQLPHDNAPVSSNALETLAAGPDEAHPVEPIAPLPVLQTQGASVPSSLAPIPQKRSFASTAPTNGVPTSALEEGYSLLDSPITAVPGVGSIQETKLNKLGLRTVRDLLLYFPREHRDYSKLLKIGQLPYNEVVTILGIIWEVKNISTGSGKIRTIAKITDETGQLQATWFNQPYLLKQLPKGASIVVTGIKQRFSNRVEFVVRSYELPETGDLLNTGRLVPVYPLTEGIGEKALRRYTKWAVDRCAQMLPEHLPGKIQVQAKLLSLPEAVSQFHYPDNEEWLVAGRRRLAFDELFLIQLGMLARKEEWQGEKQGPRFLIDRGLIFSDCHQPGQPSLLLKQATEERLMLWPPTATCLEEILPFNFTNAQRQVISEIFAELEESRPMSRLLEGDVGSGKTVVAAAALLTAAYNGYQGVIMAPTEVLAEQHYRTLRHLLEPFGIPTALLTGSMKAKEKIYTRQSIAKGEMAVIIGTHAVIQEGVSFQKLGLAIIDEQHRFGVEQRQLLCQKGYNPHLLVMTATPIPRTLALTMYGDLDLSIIDEMPPGRQRILTRWCNGPRRADAYRAISDEVQKGRQAFIICPLIEESEKVEAKAAVAEYERLRTTLFPVFRLGLLHGGMKPAEKETVMRRFRDGALDILVSTAVVEVGIDVPNATIIVMEDADRFGLSQLHQFRGRVGRGQHQSYCYLLSENAGLQGEERLSIMERTDDGFALAEEDLRLRGPGEFFGTRQSGVPELRVAKLSDTELLETAREQAKRLWNEDRYVRNPEHKALKARVAAFWDKFVGN